MSDYKTDRARKYYHLNIGSQNFIGAMTVRLKKKTEQKQILIIENRFNVFQHIPH